MTKKGIKIDPNTNSDIQAKPLRILTAIAGVVINCFTNNYGNIPDNAYSFIDSIEIKDRPGKLLYRLVVRSLVDAIVTLIVESGCIENKEYIVTDDLETAFNDCILSNEYYIDREFFSHPGNLSLLHSVKKPLSDFLRLFSIPEYDRQNILNRFSSYFGYSLTEEWQKNHAYYKELLDTVITPFDEYNRQVMEWNNYNQYLNKQIHLPMYMESFSLADVYIPLRCFYKKRIKDKKLLRPDQYKDREKYEMKVVSCDSYLKKWIDKEDQGDAIRIIKGGPGYGKSSCLKMMAARLSNDGRKILYIPLHCLDIQVDVKEAVREFLNNSGLINSDPFQEQKLIVFFDGLDELSMQGKILADAAQEFLRQIELTVYQSNHNILKLQVVVSGRDVIIQKNEDSFRKDEQIITLLPYHVDNFLEIYSDTSNLLRTDQRYIWWAKYSKLMGVNFTDIPDVIKEGNLGEITSLPLLNYLIAFSYHNNMAKLTGMTNLNSIYYQLIKEVYKRSYVDNKSRDNVLRALNNINFETFCRLMEEIALAALQGKGRITSVKEIRRHLEGSNIGKKLDSFTEDAVKGVISLLAAFYFRKAGIESDGTETFEFTHKSFGEYLAAKRIVDQIKLIHRKLIESETSLDDGWNITACLIEWTKLFCPRDIDRDLLAFIQCEIQILFEQSKNNIYDLFISIQNTVLTMLQYVVDYGLPKDWYKEFQHLNLTYKEETNYSINAERALLIIHSLFAGFSDHISVIKWQNNSSFSEWLSRINTQRTKSGRQEWNYNQSTYLTDLIFDSLHHLDLSNTCMIGKDLYLATFNRSRLCKSDLREANLIGASLKRVDLKGANLSDANLSEADIFGAYLKGTNLRGAKMENVDLQNANLKGALMIDVDLRRANLTGANLSEANLKGANLTGANLTGANLSNIKFDDFTKVNKVTTDNESILDDAFMRMIRDNKQ